MLPHVWTTILSVRRIERNDSRPGEHHLRQGSNLIGDVAYEERATLSRPIAGRDNHADKELLDEALKVASGADVIVAALGESSE